MRTCRDFTIGFQPDGQNRHGKILVAWCARCGIAVDGTAEFVEILDRQLLRIIINLACHVEGVRFVIHVPKSFFENGETDIGPIHPLHVVPPFHLLLANLTYQNNMIVGEIIRYISNIHAYMDRLRARARTNARMRAQTVERGRSNAEEHPPLPPTQSTIKKPSCFDCHKTDLTEFMHSKEGGYDICMSCFEYRQSMGRAKEAKN